MHRRLSLAAAALLLAFCPRALAQGEAAHLTVYDAGIAEFLEERAIELQPGLNQVEWRSLMPRAFVRTLRVMADEVEVVRQDVTCDGAQVVGQDRVPLTPPGGEFSVRQGRSSTLFGTRQVLERRQVEYRSQEGNTRHKLVTRIEVVLSNRGWRAAEAFVREGVEQFADNQWVVLEASAPHERLAANSLQFRVEVPAGGQTTVTYTVETK